MIKKALINGLYSETISIYDRGFNYGDGLFETIKINHATPQLLEQHLQRLLGGCHRLSINCDIELLRAEIRTLLEEQLSAFADGNAVLKIILTRGEAERGYWADLQHNSSRIITLSAAADYLQEQQGITATVCKTRLAINPMLAGIKHLCRLENVMARAEWSSLAIREGVLLSTDDHIIEGTMSNLFFIRNGLVYTPDLSKTGVNGIIRDTILNVIVPDLGLATMVGDFSLDDLYQADEIFFTNSLIELWPVIAMGDHIFELGATTKNIQQALAGYLNA
jgi:4-amino-4-deoxychorismate lyase